MEKDKTTYIVKEKESMFREEIVEFLEEQGYMLDETESRSRQEIIDYFLPIMINIKKKVYAMMGNVTCAAAASSTGEVHTRKEFFAAFGQAEPEYEEYKRLICMNLIESTWRYSKERAKEIIVENERFVRKAFSEGVDAEDTATEIGYGCG